MRSLRALKAALRAGVTLVLFMGVSFSPALAEPVVVVDTSRPGVLNLRSGDVDTGGQPNLLREQPAGGFVAGAHHVIALDGPMTAERRAALESAGVKLGDYLPADAFVADLSGANPAEVAALGFVTWAGEYQPGWKLDPSIGQTQFQTAERQAITARGDVAVTVYLFDNEPVGPALDSIDQIAGAQVMVTDQLADQPLINVVLPAASVPALAAIAGVQFVEEYPEFTYRNTSDRWIVQSNVLNVTPLYDHGLHGEGQVLGHIDGKVAVNHCSFSDTNPIGPTHRKILAYNVTTGYDGHGTHTAGTAVGDGGAFNDTRGIAYLGKLVYNSIPSLNETAMFNRLNTHRTQGATVHTNSWGNDGTTNYDGVCRAIDNFSWQYDDALVCFAVTNLSLLKNPENAKNCLAVGASQDTPNQANHCSGGAGPTADGRRKPEIYAPGCGTISASGSTGCGTASMSGTSMASPAVAGTAMLVRQYFTDGFYPSGAATPADAFTPSGALLKAMLINSAVDMTGISGYPSNQEGWGRVLADNSVYFAGDARKLIVDDVRNSAADGLTTGESVTYTFLVNSTSQQLRVTLAWHDYPGASGAANPAVNNLDLSVTTPASTVYLGNVFSGGVSVTGGAADAKNNVEQVHLNTPAAGTWTVTVAGTAVNTGVQGYALVITGDVSPLVCPTISEQPAPATVNRGQSAVFTVTASGTPAPTYQWRKDTTPLSNGGNISGATTATLTINPVGAADAGSYDVVITNTCGSTTSDPAALTVNGLVGDLNCDGVVDNFDINPFVLALTNPAGYVAAYPNCDINVADINGDNAIDNFDINPFVALLTGP